MSIFYHIYDKENGVDGIDKGDLTKGVNVFEIVGIPICNDKEETIIYINSYSKEDISLKNYVASGHGELNGKTDEKDGYENGRT